MENYARQGEVHASSGRFLAEFGENFTIWKREQSSKKRNLIAKTEKTIQTYQRAKQREQVRRLVRHALSFARARSIPPFPRLLPFVLPRERTFPRSLLRSPLEPRTLPLSVARTSYISTRRDPRTLEKNTSMRAKSARSTFSSGKNFVPKPLCNARANVRGT